MDIKYVMTEQQSSESEERVQHFFFTSVVTVILLYLETASLIFYYLKINKSYLHENTQVFGDETISDCYYFNHQFKITC